MTKYREIHRIYPRVTKNIKNVVDLIKDVRFAQGLLFLDFYFSLYQFSPYFVYFEHLFHTYIVVF